MAGAAICPRCRLGQGGWVNSRSRMVGRAVVALASVLILGVIGYGWRVY